MLVSYTTSEKSWKFSSIHYYPLLLYEPCSKTTCLCRRFYANQKKILELNPRHPLVKELKQRIEVNKDEQTTKDLAMVLFETATLRSNFLVQDTAAFAGRIERMLRLSMDIPLDEKVRRCLFYSPYSGIGHIETTTKWPRQHNIM